MWVKGLEFREKVDQIKSCCILSGWLLLCVPRWCLSLEHNGSDTVLITAVLLRHKGELVWSPGVRVGHIFSSWNNSVLHSLITKLIDDYPKLKFSSSWVPCHNMEVALPVQGGWFFPSVLLLFSQFLTGLNVWQSFYLVTKRLGSLFHFLRAHDKNSNLYIMGRGDRLYLLDQIWAPFL